MTRYRENMRCVVSMLNDTIATWLGINTKISLFVFGYRRERVSFAMLTLEKFCSSDMVLLRETHSWCFDKEPTQLSGCLVSWSFEQRTFNSFFAFLQASGQFFLTLKAACYKLQPLLSPGWQPSRAVRLHQICQLYCLAKRKESVTSNIHSCLWYVHCASWYCSEAEYLIYSAALKGNPISILYICTTIPFKGQRSTIEPSCSLWFSTLYVFLIFSNVCTLGWCATGWKTNQSLPAENSHIRLTSLRCHGSSFKRL